MQRVISLSVIILLAAFVALSSDSCAPGANVEVDTTQMVADSPVLNLTRADTAKSTAIRLTCGCAFQVTYTMGGDTNVIHFTLKERADTLVNAHNLVASFSPSKQSGSGKDSAWIAFYHLYQGSRPLRDTVRAYATW